LAANPPSAGVFYKPCAGVGQGLVGVEFGVDVWREAEVDTGVGAAVTKDTTVECGSVASVRIADKHHPAKLIEAGEER